jgi:phage terminase large subunit
LDEYAQMSSRIFTEIFRPALADRKGSAVFIGTPQGRINNFFERWEAAATLDNWGQFLFTVDDTGLLDLDELAQARAEMSDDEYAQEFFCSFDASIKHAYWGAEMNKAVEEKRITKVAHQEGYPVYTIADLGARDAYAIWYMQLVGNEMHFLEYEEFTYTSIPNILKHFATKPYLYEQHIAPHDIRQFELGAGCTRFETALKHGVRFKICPNIPKVEGREAVRINLSRCYFDEVKCKHGIEALRMFHAKYDEKNRAMLDEQHDWSSHGADAMRYACVFFGKGRQQTLLDKPLDYSLQDKRAASV